MKKRILCMAGKVLLFVSLLLYLAATVSIAELWNAGYDSETYLPVKDFYKSERFADVLQQWSFTAMDFWKIYVPEAGVEKQEDSSIQKEETVYSLAEYDTLAGQFDESPKVDAQFQNVTFQQLMKSEENIATNIQNGDDNGGEYYYFYNELRNYIQKELKTSGTKKFVHLSGREYYGLVLKYAEEKTMSSDLIGEEYPDVYENYDGYSAMGFFNEFNGNLVVYSPSTEEGGNGNFCLVTANQDFSYALEDAGRKQDYYIPADLLDYSSLENFQKSLITTPFTTVEKTLPFLGMQEYMNDVANGQEDECDWYDSSILEEVYYKITYKNADKEKKEYTNCNEEAWKNARYVITYSLKDGKFDSKTQELLDSGTLRLTDAFAQNISSMEGVQEVSVGVKPGIAYNLMGIAIYDSFVQEHIEAYMGTAVGCGIIFFLLLAAILRMEPAALYKRDRHYLISKTILLGGVEVALIMALTGCFVVLSNTQVLSTAILVEVGIIIVLLLFLMYWAAAEYFLSQVRLCKAKEWKQYVFLHHIWKKYVCRTLHRGKQAVGDMWRHQSVARRSVVLVIGYLVGNLIILFIAMCTDIFGVFLLLAAIAVNIDIVYRVYRDMRSMDVIIEGIQKIIDGNLSYQIDTSSMKGHKKELAQYVNRIGEGLDKSVAASLRDERLKTELITNVSHDIKTPLTSIINYVDLIKREGISEEPVKGYVEVLDKKSQRLKQLIEDLVEASKASTGNIEMTPVNLDMTELVNQTVGEFEDKFKERNLELVMQMEETPMVIYADGRRCYRIVENLFQNVYKYAMPHTRVYLSMRTIEEQVELCIKNISEAPLNIAAEELTQRFVRGEESRTTEGSGLGLSIAQNLTQLQKGRFDVALDGDLFKVTIVFPIVKREEQDVTESENA